jgi:hypothetical protein
MAWSRKIIKEEVMACELKKEETILNKYRKKQTGCQL